MVTTFVVTTFAVTTFTVTTFPTTEAFTAATFAVATFTKGTFPKLGNWFAWKKSADESLDVWWAEKMILEWSEED